MGIHRLQHTSIPMPSGGKPEAQRFYTEVMGLEQIPTPSSLDASRIVWFSVSDDGDELHLYTEDGFRSDTNGQHLCLVVDDLDTMRAVIESDGIEIHHEPEIAFRPRFSFRDPFGNKIEITEIRGNYLDAEV
ncbi:MAG TPA: VOC family protein [Thermomicrobiales bacterium]|nr:VOC family protein [Thermomicrobiales bacterium]